MSIVAALVYGFFAIDGWRVSRGGAIVCGLASCIFVWQAVLQWLR